MNVAYMTKTLCNIQAFKFLKDTISPPTGPQWPIFFKMSLSLLTPNNKNPYNYTTSLNP